MSLQGTASAKELRGKINGLDVLTVDAYAIAVQNGFKGTEAEWLASLKGEDGYTPVKGVDYYTKEDIAELLSLLNNGTSFISYIDLVASKCTD